MAALDRLSGEAEEAFESIADDGESYESVGNAAYAASYVSAPEVMVENIFEVFNAVANAMGGPAECAVQASLLRDVFGNPFRPVAFDPRWRTADVTALARGIYDDRAFDRLPLLADALMAAGCDSEDLLAHCRSEGPHVRGCWVVDLVLGKE